MKIAIDLAALLLGVFVAFIIQDALPPIIRLHGAHVILVPLVFFYAAILMPFPAMLLAAVYTGYLSDLMYLHVVTGKVEIPLGYSILFFVIFGCVANGFRPAMKAGNYLPLVTFGGLGTSFYLLMQFLLITIQRGGFIWEEAVTWRIIVPGVLAALLAPLFYWTVSHIDRLLPSGARKTSTV